MTERELVITRIFDAPCEAGWNESFDKLAESLREKK